MLNKLDDAIAPNICQIALILLVMAQFLFLVAVGDLFFYYLLLVTLTITSIVLIKVIYVSHERKRVYWIIKKRILKRGYDKLIFSGKCVNICQLMQALYIATRYKSHTDFTFFYNDHRKKIPFFIMDDEVLENILNNLDHNNIEVGKVIHQYNK